MHQCEAAREAYNVIREQRKRPYVTIKYCTALSGVCKGRVKRIQGANDKASENNSERCDDDARGATAQRNRLVRFPLHASWARECSLEDAVPHTVPSRACASPRACSKLAHLFLLTPTPTTNRRGVAPPWRVMMRPSRSAVPIRSTRRARRRSTRSAPSREAQWIRCRRACPPRISTSAARHNFCTNSVSWRVHVGGFLARAGGHVHETLKPATANISAGWAPLRLQRAVF